MEPMSEQTIFPAALDKDPAERAAFLEEACAGDTELKRSVEGLLRLHTEAHAFLDVPAPEQLAAAGMTVAKLLAGHCRAGDHQRGGLNGDDR
jgi:hypothetical protein